MRQKDAAERRARHARQAQKQAEQHSAETDWYVQECQERLEELYSEIAGLKTQLCRANLGWTQAEEHANQAREESEGLRQVLEKGCRYWTEQAKHGGSRRKWPKAIKLVAVATVTMIGLAALKNVIGTFPVLIGSLFLFGTLTGRRFFAAE